FGHRRPRCAEGSSLRAEKPISRSQWNAGYGADSGPSRGDLRRRASRPIEASKAAIRNVRLTSTPAVRLVSIRDVQSLSTNVRCIGLGSTVELGRTGNCTEEAAASTLRHVGLNSEALAPRRPRPR